MITFELGITKAEQESIEKEIGDLLYKTDGLHDEAHCRAAGGRVLRMLVRKLRPDLLAKGTGRYIRPDGMNFE